MYVATSKRCSREHDLAVYSVARGSDQGSSNGTEKVGGYNTPLEKVVDHEAMPLKVPSCAPCSRAFADFYSYVPSLSWQIRYLYILGEGCINFRAPNV